MRFFVPTGKGVLEFNQKGAARKNTGCPFLKTAVCKAIYTCTLLLYR